jgi:hypothetical protein
MSSIPTHPRPMPKFEKWLTKFSSNYDITIEEHIDNFYACFQYFSPSEDDENVIMRLFSAS